MADTFPLFLFAQTARLGSNRGCRGKCPGLGCLGGIGIDGRSVANAGMGGNISERRNILNGIPIIGRMSGYSVIARVIPVIGKVSGHSVIASSVLVIRRMAGCVIFLVWIIVHILPHFCTVCYILNF